MGARRFGERYGEGDSLPYADPYLRRGLSSPLPGKLILLASVHLGPVSTAGDDLFVTQNNGAGASSSITAPLATRPGIIRFTTGTTATGRSSTQTVGITTGNFLTAATLNVRFSMGLRVPVLSDAAQEFAAGGGFSDTGVAFPSSSNGLLFAYQRAVTGVNWFSSKEEAAASDSDDTGLVVTAGQFLDIRQDILGTSGCRTIVDNVQKASHAGFAAGVALGAMLGIFKSVGVTARDFDADYFELELREVV